MQEIVYTVSLYSSVYSTSWKQKVTQSWFYLAPQLVVLAPMNTGNVSVGGFNSLGAEDHDIWLWPWYELDLWPWGDLDLWPRDDLDFDLEMTLTFDLGMTLTFDLEMTLKWPQHLTFDLEINWNFDLEMTFDLWLKNYFSPVLKLIFSNHSAQLVKCFEKVGSPFWNC